MNIILYNRNEVLEMSKDKKINQPKKKKKKVKNLGMKITAIFMLLVMIASIVASIFAYI